MSTILKALRRLENEDPKKKRTGAPPVLRDDPTSAPFPATDPRAADALRGRILAEEAAARVGAETRDDDSPKPRRLRPLIVRALVASLLVAGIAFAVTKSGFFSAAPTDGNTPEPAPSNELAAAQPTLIAGDVNPSAPAPLPAPRAMVAVPSPLAVSEQAANAPIPTAAPVAPVPAVAPPMPAPNVATEPTAPVPPIVPAATAQATPSPVQSVAAAPVARPMPSPSPQALPTPAVAANPSPMPPPDSAAQPPALSPPPPTQTTAARAPSPRSAPPAASPAAPPPRVEAPAAASSSVETAVVRPPPAAEPARSAPRPAPQKTSASAPAPVHADEFKRVVPAGLAEVTVVRTAWHPKPERRSAKVRIAETNEVVTAHEGDTVAGLILLEITPSAVVFSAGDVEIRRRVGEKTTTR